MSVKNDSFSVPFSNATPGQPATEAFKPGDPCPYLFTEEDTIRYMRLDLIEIKNPSETLRRYRKEGLLKGTQVSKKVFYLRENVDAFLKKQTDENPR